LTTVVGVGAAVGEGVAPVVAAAAAVGDDVAP
jgi:hypothetical protein